MSRVTILETNDYSLEVGEDYVYIIIGGEATVIDRNVFYYNPDIHTVIEYRCKDIIGFVIHTQHYDDVWQPDLTVMKVSPKLESRVKKMGMYAMGNINTGKLPITFEYDEKTEMFTIDETIFTLSQLEKVKFNDRLL